MTGRRAGNRIRGPQSALTDFLATHNISAAQIRQDFESRRQAANQPNSAAAAAGSSNDNGDTDDEDIVAAVVAADLAEEAEKFEEKNKKRKRNEKEVIEKIQKSKASSSKKGKGKKKKKKDSDDDDLDSDDNYDDRFMREIYRKARPAPGQFEYCELCQKRFTVTPYSKEGPDNGLLCTPCGKTQTKDLKQEKARATAKPAGRKRRKLESDRLDGIAAGGSKSLQQLCIAKVAEHHEDIDELGELPQGVLEKLGEIFSKKRVMKPRTLPLFLRPDLDSVVVHDAAYLEVENYNQIFATVPRIQRLVLGNCCQLKDESIDYMLDRCHDLKHLQLYAANLVSDEGWNRLFHQAGEKLEVVKLSWLDAAFDDNSVRRMVQGCPNLRRLKLKLCRRIGEDAVVAISDIPHLEHISLLMNKQVTNEVLVDLVIKRGSALRTLSLEKFMDIDDTVFTAIHDTCTRLSKLRITENDTATDSAFTSLFTDWSNPPLSFVDLNSNRDVDNNNPDGPEQAIGLSSAGFRAMMAHSGPGLKHLDISSCRHIELSAFMDVFNGSMDYPALEYINVSFCNRIENTVVAGIFRSCPKLKKLIAFGCFDIQDVVVPRNITLIGVPRAQDAIEQYGVGIDVDEALQRMVEVAA